MRVIVPALGGGFGTGLDTHVYEYISILLAWRTGKPVKILYDREEEFAYLSPRQSAQTRIRQGCDAEGRLTLPRDRGHPGQRRLHLVGGDLPSVMLLPVTSLYRVPAVRFDAQIVYTNNTYCQAMRGYGNPEVTWPIESSLDELAEMAGSTLRDAPPELQPARRDSRRWASRSRPAASRVPREDRRGPGVERQAWTAKASGGGARKRGRRHGLADPRRGGGKIYRSDGSGIILKLDDYGNVNVNYGGVEMGQGLHSALTAMVADALGVKPESVVINQTDTATCPWDVGTHASRGAFMAGNAAIMACEKLRERIFEWAERLYPRRSSASWPA